MLTAEEASKAIESIRGLAAEVKAARADGLTREERRKLAREAIRALADFAIDVLD